MSEIGSLSKPHDVVLSCYAGTTTDILFLFCFAAPLLSWVQGLGLTPDMGGRPSPEAQQMCMEQ